MCCIAELQSNICGEDLSQDVLEDLSFEAALRCRICVLALLCESSSP